MSNCEEKANMTTESLARPRRSKGWIHYGRGLMLAAALVLGALATAAPATASVGASAGPGQPAPSPGHHLGGLQQLAAGSTYPVNFYNWSGYAATGGKPFVAVESTYVQPAVSCPVPGAWTVFWVGFDGFFNGTVEQAGTEAICGSGPKPTATYYAWWEMYPTNSIQAMPITVRPGDSIHASVTFDPRTATYAMTVVDKTSGQRYTQTARCAPNLTCSRDSAEWIVERPTLGSVYTPLADWSTMRLAVDRAATATQLANGKVTAKPAYQPVSGFPYTPINMVDDPYTGKTLATVGPLSDSGGAFTDTWLAPQ
jgi:hypothetical protein